ncbi:MAG TPA: hypothetical protein VFX22_06290 [Candidatus Kapabacteria bacterium]|nr:hypothetical protein [Candidatus Kapabacteria bacterium]
MFGCVNVKNYFSTLQAYFRWNVIDDHRLAFDLKGLLNESFFGSMASAYSAGKHQYFLLLK